MNTTIPITILFDPLCGWCYGAAPALERLLDSGDFTVELAPTGLFAGTGARPMDAQFAAYAWDNDQRIAQLTGQAFSEDYRHKVLAAPGAMFDSGPATRALTAVNLSAPAREFEALEAIQRVRYVEGRDNADPAVVAEVLSGLGLDEAARRFTAGDEALLAADRARIEAGRAQMRRFGARGVPALIAGQGESRRLVGANVLFGSLEELVADLKAG